MKKLNIFFLAIIFLAGNVGAQTLTGQLVDKTGTDFFYYWYVGTIGKQIAVSSDGDVHITYNKTYATVSDTGHQVKYANVTDGVIIDVPSQEPDKPLQPGVSFIGGGNGDTPVYIMYGVGGRFYNYGPAMHLQAMAKVGDDGVSLDPLGIQPDRNYGHMPHYANPFAMEVSAATGIAHVLLTNPGGNAIGYWNFDGTNFGEIYQMYFSNSGSDVPGKNVPARQWGDGRNNQTEGGDLALTSDGSEVAIAGLHPWAQIFIHKGIFGGELWDDDFWVALDNGTCIPLFDTAQAISHWDGLDNEPKPASDVQVVYDANNKLVVTYIAGYKTKQLDTLNSVSWGTWWDDHSGICGDTEGVFYDGTTHPKGQIRAWTEVTGTHTEVAQAMYPKIGDTFKWWSYGVIDSGNAMWGNAYADQLIGNIELVVNSGAEEGDPKFVMLYEQMATDPVELVDTNWAFGYTYFGYNSDLFAVTSVDGATWTAPINLTDSPNKDENDLSAVIADGMVHIMWYSDNLPGRDRIMAYADIHEDPADPTYVRWTENGAHFAAPMRVREADQVEVLYQAVPVGDLVVGVDDVTVPGKFELAQNYPNPFNPSTTISYSIPARSDVTIKVYNSLGELVTTLFDGVSEAGSHEVSFNASNISTGVYLYSINAGNFTQTKKMILLK